MLKLLPIVLWGLFLAYMAERHSRYTLDSSGRKYYLQKDRFFWFVMTVSLAVFVGLRTRGNDTFTYRSIYNVLIGDIRAIASINWLKISGAPGLQFLSIVLKSMGSSTQDYLMITSLFTICVYLWFVRKYSSNLFLSVFYFITMGVYTFTMAAIKQTMAVAFLLLATDNAIQKKWPKYLFWVVIAELFHPYAFIYLVVPFVAFRPWSQKTRFLLAGSVIVALLMSRLLASIDILTTALGYSYSAGTFSGAGVNIFRVLVVWVPLVLSYLKKERLQQSDDRATNIIVNLMMVNAVIMFIGLFGTANYFARLANYFLIFQCLALPYIISLFNADNRMVLTRASMLGFTAYFYYSEALANGRFDLNYGFMTLTQYLMRR